MVRSLRTVLALAVAPALLSAPAGAAPAFTNLTVLVGGNGVYGELVHPPAGVSAEVAADLLGPDGTPRAWAQSTVTAEGGFDLAFVTGGLAPRRPVLIAPGDTVRLGGPAGATSDLPVPALSAAADPATDRVSGSAPPGTALMVTAEDLAGARANRVATSDATGAWTADFAGEMDLAPGARGVAVFRDQGDVIWQTEWSLLGLRAAVGAGHVTVFTQLGAAVRLRQLRGPAGELVAAGQAIAAGHRLDIPLVAGDGAAAVVLPGDVLEIGLDDQPVSRWPMPNVEVEMNRADGMVAGTADPGRRIEVVTGRATHSVTAGPDGTWLVRLAPDEVASEGACLVRFPDAPHASVTAADVAIADLGPFEATVTGQGTAGTPVGLAVRHGGLEVGRAAGRVEADGIYQLTARTPTGTVVPRMAGATWRMDYAGRSTELPVAPFDVAADSALGEIWGTAGPGMTVRLGGVGLVTTTVAAADGSWRVRYPPGAVLPGAAVMTEAGDGDGPTTRLAWQVFRASAQVNGDRVRLEGPPGLAAGAEVTRNEALTGVGSCQVPVEGGRCELTVTGRDGRPLRLAPGDRVQVTPNRGQAAVIELVPLEAHVDGSAASVVGSAPPRVPLRIEFGHVFDLRAPIDAGTRSFGSGVFDYELSLAERQLLTPGTTADVFLATADGHQQFARAVLEALSAQVGGAGVTAWAEPGATVTITRTRTSAAPVAASAVAGADGRADLALVAGGAASASHAGDDLTLDFGRGRRALRLPPLSAWLDAPSGAVVALSTPGLTVRAWSGLPAGPVPQRPGPRLEGRVDSSGIAWLDVYWSAPSADPTWLDALLPGGDAVSVPEPVVAGPPGRLALPWLGRAAP